MEIVIQTKKHMFSISRCGIRRVDMWEWRKIKETFEVLFNQQSVELSADLDAMGPVPAAIQKTVDAGHKVAAANAEAWRHPGDNRLP